MEARLFSIARRFDPTDIVKGSAVALGAADAPAAN